MLVAVLLVSVVVVSATACGGGGGAEVAVASKRSDPRPTTTIPAPSVASATTTPQTTGGATEVSVFCDRLRAVTALPPTDDPVEAVRRFAGLADGAPAAVAEPFRTLVGVSQRLEALPREAPGSAEAALGILVDPAVTAAGVALENWAQANCGFGISSEPPAGPGGPGGDPSTAGTIRLEDVSAVEEANPDRSWTGKVDSTTIIGDNDVQLGAGGSDLSAPEALEACEAVRTALVATNPRVVVRVQNGTRTVAASPVGGTCAIT